MTSSNRTLLSGLSKPIIGMVHLLPLPGSPRFRGSFDEVFDAAMADAHTLAKNGIDAIMVENYGDVPFYKSEVEPHTVALMARIATEIRWETGMLLGINVLRNDAHSALGIALAAEADMIRINVHTGTMVTDQGVIEGNARETLDYRNRLGTDVKILADVHVKHARPLVSIPVEEYAADTVERGLADAVIITGTRTGGAINLDEMRNVHQAVNVPVLAGSGVTIETIEDVLAECDGTIVGSWFKHDGQIANPVDPERVQRLMALARTIQK